MNNSDSSPEWPAKADSIPAPPELPYPEVDCDWNALHSIPIIDPTAWVTPDAIVTGRVRLKARSSVWHQCVLRGDLEYIEVGEETNVQDGSILHTDYEHPCILGNRVTLGHAAIVHGSIVEDDAMIAIGATVLSRCVIGKGALIAAGALVREGIHVPPNTLWAGCPARQIKVLTEQQQERLKATWQHYVNLGAASLQQLGREHIDALTQRG
ncbi:2,3,4,5-tetrahydropyridine-2,6-dicarboxylate N-acetyltransferase [Gimesia alba]|uniref:2,3,4,5-tetrahydropyridine-2,6-dicarboxylate N-acetyltransferase n=1 Tax=Gimesia alba TaxID=2527973 RepID=A0A517RLR0_9PLAN|nr:gamma carbonic anhydrase family protein [Gimesia alba]QDT44815.1 2,3,4,5-tetrahydropyridine-2,6-dicarboxylate N-acetyltransferase [Gimesia alba]